jgi:hypothetical protein
VGWKKPGTLPYLDDRFPFPFLAFADDLGGQCFADGVVPAHKVNSLDLASGLAKEPDVPKMIIVGRPKMPTRDSVRGWIRGNAYIRFDFLTLC